jgi:transcriptional regulator with XRE-family HTH domain
MAKKTRAARKGPFPPKQRATEVDVHVGQRIRQRRTQLGLSQTNLGQALGVTFQQVQKYEKGVNRVGSSRLAQLAEVLQVPIESFFEGAPGNKVKRLKIGDSIVADADLAAFLGERTNLRMIANFLAADAKLKKAVQQMLATATGRGDD